MVRVLSYSFIEDHMVANLQNRLLVATRNTKQQLMDARQMEMEMEFFKIKHTKYFRRYLQLVPSRFQSMDTSRLTLAFFAISGLDLLQSLDELDSERDSIIDWIYSLQVLPCLDESNSKKCGFRGTTAIHLTKKDEESHPLSESVPYDCGHIAMTYTGLASLIILGDDLSRVNKAAIVTGLRALQLPDGSFSAMVNGSENDMRFVYCAAAISYVLQDWRGMDIPLALKYIRNSISYDHGLGQGRYSEAHGGLTFCAIAALNLMGNLHSTLNEREIKQLVRWCVFRQQSGFHGRPNKEEDTCYSFWVGATLDLLDAFQFVNRKENRQFILAAQNRVTGGMSKYPYSGQSPDPLHTYTGLGGLSLMGEDGVRPINSALNISVRATDFLHKLHKRQGQTIT